METLNTVLFYILAVLTGVSAVGVVVTQNIVRSATWLLFTLAGAAGVFFLLGADFVGATQLLIYVGGTLVLVVFGVMLTAQGPFINLRISAAEWLIGLAVGVVVYGVLASCLMQFGPAGEGEKHAATTQAGGESETREPALPEPTMQSRLGAALLGDFKATPEANLTGLPASIRPLDRRRMNYLLPFEIVSIHLLVVLVGAAYLARAKRRRAAATT
jgi:NADH-quinone oxidoreductase subunit J